MNVISNAPFDTDTAVFKKKKKTLRKRCEMVL